jgi:protein TonB
LPSRSSGKSRPLPAWLVRILKAPAWALSSSFHALVALIIAFVFWVDTWESTVPFEVIEMPIVASQPLRPAAQQAPPKPTPENKVKPRAVFGASRKSVTSAEGVDVKAGNTIAKDPDTKQLRAEDEDELPLPTEEYLVSKMPELIEDIRVPYPPEAKKRNVEGAVLVDILIDAAGRVREAVFVEGPGFGLNEAALEAVKRFRFRAAEVDGQPVAVRIRYAYRFVIER